MAELGDDTESEHAHLAALATALGVEVTGYRTDLYGSARVDDVPAALELLSTLGSADAALLKGSRVVQLEDVAAAFAPVPDYETRSTNSP